MRLILQVIFTPATDIQYTVSLSSLPLVLNTMNPIVHKKYALQFPNVETSKRRIEGKQHKQNSFRTPQWWLCLLFIFVLVQLAAVVTASAEENRDKLRSSSRSLRVLRFESNDSIVSPAEDGDFNASGSLVSCLTTYNLRKG